MALITRISRLFRADFHAVLDRIEEPDILLRQAIREMEEELSRDQQRIKGLNHEQGQLMARKSELDQSMSKIEEELDVCFVAGKDDLARVLIKRKLEAQRTFKYLTSRNMELGTTLAGLTARLEDGRMRLDAMRQKAELLSDGDVSAYPENSLFTPAHSIREEDVEVAFLREKQNRSRP
jgi:phage shock protein A